MLLRLCAALAAVAAVLAADPPDVEIKYFNNTNCDSGGSGLSTQVMTQSRLCNIVPGAPNPSSYRVICNTKGNGGTAFFCADTTCQNCPSQLPFNDNSCLQIDPRYGSSSAEFDCKGGDSQGQSGAGAAGVATAAVAGAVAFAAQLF